MQQFFDFKGEKMSYYLTKIDNPTYQMVYLSGFGGAETYYDFKTLASYLKNGTHYFLDVFGTGLSDETKRSRSLQAIGEEILAFLETLPQTLPLYVCGHSFGGVYLKEIFKQRPRLIKGAVFIEPTTFYSENLFKNNPLYQVEEEKFAALTEEERKVIFSDPFWSLEDQVNQEKHEKPFEEETTLKRSYQEMTENLKDSYLTPIPYFVPVLIFTQGFRKEEYQESSYYHLNGEIVTLEGSHYLQFQHPQEMAEKITEFVAKQVQNKAKEIEESHHVY